MFRAVRSDMGWFISWFSTHAMMICLIGVFVLLIL